ncbi:YggT family protein [Candidatus Parcubacteria bacterium]|nr:YggT family protein [Candidatus Parcubacteria bacterium]
MESSYNSPATKPLYRGVQIAWYILGIVEFLIVVRFIFRLLGANPASPFVNLIYNLTQPLVGPFVGIFPRIASQGFVIEWSCLVALLVYYFLVWAIVKLFLISKPVSTPEAAQKLNREEEK